MDEQAAAILAALEQVDFMLLGMGKKILNWEDEYDMSPFTREVLQKIGHMEQCASDLIRSIKQYYPDGNRTVG